MLETNPGPGLGLLLAYWFAGKGLAKLSAPGSIIIHFFGGIHEVYFPYVLMNPVMIIAMWAGGISADIIFVIFDAGLKVVPSPGSVFAYIGGTPTDGGAAAGVWDRHGSWCGSHVLRGKHLAATIPCEGHV